MIIKSQQTNKKIVGPMIIKEYNINSNYSAALIEINGNHGEVKSISEDRIYFILTGEGKFIINNEENNIEPNDLVYVPMNTPYNIIGKMKFLLICSPEFNAKNDIHL